jgi:hypothetical protein
MHKSVASQLTMPWTGFRPSKASFGSLTPAATPRPRNNLECRARCSRAASSNWRRGSACGCAQNAPAPLQQSPRNRPRGSRRQAWDGWHHASRRHPHHAQDARSHRPRALLWQQPARQPGQGQAPSLDQGLCPRRSRWRHARSAAFFSPRRHLQPLVSVFMPVLYESDFAAPAEPNPLRRTQYSHSRSDASGEAAMSAVATISSSERKVTSPKRMASVCRRALTIR